MSNASNVATVEETTNVAIETTKRIEREAVKTMDRTTRNALRMKAGQYVRQGDVYITKLSDKPEFDQGLVDAFLAKCAKREYFSTATNVKFKEAQYTAETAKRLKLAPGENQGSRHEVPNPAASGVKIWSPVDRTTCELVGDVLVIDRDSVEAAVDNPVAVEHPEHADCILGGGLYITTYQADALRPAQRVRD